VIDETMAKVFVFGALMLGVTACKSAPTEQDKAARIVDPDDASRAALQSVIDGALHTHVNLANDALTKSSILIIHGKSIRDSNGIPIDGRRHVPPIQFRLVTNREHCILIDQRDQSRHELENTRCEPE
jgi:hypothetical protein